MQDLLVQIQSIYAKPEDLIILTFSKEVNFEDINNSITTLAKYCYKNMFYNCINLTNVPKLPAVILAHNCYIDIFEDFTNLPDSP